MSRRRLLVITGLLPCLQILVGPPTTGTGPAGTSANPPSSHTTSTASLDPEIEAINQQIKMLRDLQR